MNTAKLLLIFFNLAVIELLFLQVPLHGAESKIKISFTGDIIIHEKMIPPEIDNRNHLMNEKIFSGFFLI